MERLAAVRQGSAVLAASADIAGCGRVEVRATDAAALRLRALLGAAASRELVLALLDEFAAHGGDIVCLAGQ